MEKQEIAKKIQDTVLMMAKDPKNTNHYLSVQ